MNQLHPPFNTFRLEKHAGEYKDFEVPEDDPYPLKGVTYPVDYGDIPGYVGEDGDDLDVFVGSGSLSGYLWVSRPDIEVGEHKFYVQLTEDEEAAVLKEFGPVVLATGRLDTFEALLAAIEPFKKQT
jgi:hypothetical protein